MIRNRLSGKAGGHFYVKKQEERVMPVVNMIETGKRIKELRIATGMSVRDIQKIFGFSTPQAIYKWMRGEAMPTIDNLIVLSYIFGVKMDDIISVDK